MKKKKSTINIDEQQKFSKFSLEWWDLNGQFAILHLFNFIRVDFIRKKLVEHNKLSTSSHYLNGLRVLDIGCGGGILCESLARLGAQVTGIDTSLNAIKVAKEHASKQNLKIDYQNCDLMKFKLESKFDVVTCMEVLEHVDNIDFLLDKTKKVLKPSGLFLGSTINRTLLSFLGAIIVAENILKLLPKKTHDWNKFIEISKLKIALTRNNFHAINFQGVKYNPLLRDWSYSKFKSINYLFCATG